jgi:hypothetical protein
MRPFCILALQQHLFGIFFKRLGDCLYRSGQLRLSSAAALNTDNLGENRVFNQAKRTVATLLILTKRTQPALYAILIRVVATHVLVHPVLVLRLFALTRFVNSKPFNSV